MIDLAKSAGDKIIIFSTACIIRGFTVKDPKPGMMNEDPESE